MFLKFTNKTSQQLWVFFKHFDRSPIIELNGLTGTGKKLEPGESVNINGSFWGNDKIIFADVWECPPNIMNMRMNEIGAFLDSVYPITAYIQLKDLEDGKYDLTEKYISDVKANTPNSGRPRPPSKPSALFGINKIVPKYHQ